MASAETGNPVVVAKYGGSSLATPEHIRAVADRLAVERADGAHRVVVVSAMGTPRTTYSPWQGASATCPTRASWTCSSPPASR